MEPSTDMNEFRYLLRTSKNIVAVAGAGLSAASGIPTFRGSGGMWRKYNAVELATPEGFSDNPSLVWQFYHYRREVALKAAPNNAHRALSLFSLPSIRNQIAPSSTFTLVTQNVDGLSPRSDKEISEIYPEALDQPQQVQPRLIEMHGRLFDVLCTDENCRHIEFNTKSPICESLAGTEILVEKNTLDPDIDIQSLPRCSQCGSLARPGVVWFDEVPHHMDVIDNIIEQADLCIVVGTSSTVYPAAGYADIVQDNGGNVAVFNLERSQNDENADFLFLGPCEETLLDAFSLVVSQDGKLAVQGSSISN
ncbi:NAD-dependent protein deacylase [Psilocybe cubensis]|uniref:NAD-dependent protein deacylase n=2 Tax=Psilocybe cubensis TaxID=181762 RepID=A0ACB8H4H6_PSICU|nr:NAD-dependent protein deacylase [Psilocybe cubensis]KAH9482610.1 NAD-dependent protein deacylase [Psilocybe cubensis]